MRQTRPTNSKLDVMFSDKLTKLRPESKLVENHSEEAETIRSYLADPELAEYVGEEAMAMLTTRHVSIPKLERMRNKKTSVKLLKGANKPLSHRVVYRSGLMIFQSHPDGVNQPWMDMAGENTICLDDNSGPMLLRSLARWFQGRFCLSVAVSPADIGFEPGGYNWSEPTDLTEQTLANGDTYIAALIQHAAKRGNTVAEFLAHHTIRQGGSMYATKIKGKYIVDPLEPKQVHRCWCCGKLNYIDGLNVDPKEANDYYDSLKCKEDLVSASIIKNRGLDINWAISSHCSGGKALYPNAYLHNTTIHNAMDTWSCALCGSDLRDTCESVQHKILAEVPIKIRYIDGTQLEELLTLGIGDVYDDMTKTARDRLIDADVKMMRKWIRKYINDPTYIPVNLSVSDYQRLKEHYPGVTAVNREATGSMAPLFSAEIDAALSQIVTSYGEIGEICIHSSSTMGLCSTSRRTITYSNHKDWINTKTHAITKRDKPAVTIIGEGGCNIKYLTNLLSTQETVYGLKVLHDKGVVYNKTGFLHENQLYLSGNPIGYAIDNEWLQMMDHDYLVLDDGTIRITTVNTGMYVNVVCLTRENTIHNKLADVVSGDIIVVPTPDNLSKFGDIALFNMGRTHIKMSPKLVKALVLRNLTGNLAYSEMKYIAELYCRQIRNNRGNMIHNKDIDVCEVEFHVIVAQAYLMSTTQSALISGKMVSLLNGLGPMRFLVQLIGNSAANFVRNMLATMAEYFSIPDGSLAAFAEFFNGIQWINYKQLWDTLFNSGMTMVSRSPKVLTLCRKAQTYHKVCRHHYTTSSYVPHGDGKCDCCGLACPAEHTHCVMCNNKPLKNPHMSWTNQKPKEKWQQGSKSHSRGLSPSYSGPGVTIHDLISTLLQARGVVESHAAESVADGSPATEAHVNTVIAQKSIFKPKAGAKPKRAVTFKPVGSSDGESSLEQDWPSITTEFEENFDDILTSPDDDNNEPITPKLTTTGRAWSTAKPGFTEPYEHTTIKAAMLDYTEQTRSQTLRPIQPSGPGLAQPCWIPMGTYTMDVGSMEVVDMVDINDVTGDCLYDCIVSTQPHLTKPMLKHALAIGNEWPTVDNAIELAQIFCFNIIIRTVAMFKVHISDMSEPISTFFDTTSDPSLSANHCVLCTLRCVTHLSVPVLVGKSFSIDDIYYMTKVSDDGLDLVGITDEAYLMSCSAIRYSLNNLTEQTSGLGTIHERSDTKYWVYPDNAILTDISAGQICVAVNDSVVDELQWFLNNDRRAKLQTRHEDHNIPDDLSEFLRENIRSCTDQWRLCQTNHMLATGLKSITNYMSCKITASSVGCWVELSTTVVAKTFDTVYIKVFGTGRKDTIVGTIKIQIGSRYLVDTNGVQVPTRGKIAFGKVSSGSILRKIVALSRIKVDGVKVRKWLSTATGIQGPPGCNKSMGMKNLTASTLLIASTSGAVRRLKELHRSTGCTILSTEKFLSNDLKMHKVSQIIIDEANCCHWIVAALAHQLKFNKCTLLGDLQQVNYKDMSNDAGLRAETNLLQVAINLGAKIEVRNYTYRMPPLLCEWLSHLGQQIKPAAENTLQWEPSWVNVSTLEAAIDICKSVKPDLVITMYKTVKAKLLHHLDFEVQTAHASEGRESGVGVVVLANDSDGTWGLNGDPHYLMVALTRFKKSLTVIIVAHPHINNMQQAASTTTRLGARLRPNIRAALNNRLSQQRERMSRARQQPDQAEVQTLTDNMGQLAPMQQLLLGLTSPGGSVMDEDMIRIVEQAVLTAKRVFSADGSELGDAPGGIKFDNDHELETRTLPVEQELPMGPQLNKTTVKPRIGGLERSLSELMCAATDMQQFMDALLLWCISNPAWSEIKFDRSPYAIIIVKTNTVVIVKFLTDSPIYMQSSVNRLTKSISVKAHPNVLPSRVVTKLMLDCIRTFNLQACFMVDGTTVLPEQQEEVTMLEIARSEADNETAIRPNETSIEDVMASTPTDDEIETDDKLSELEAMTAGAIPINPPVLTKHYRTPADLEWVEHAVQVEISCTWAIRTNLRFLGWLMDMAATKYITLNSPTSKINVSSSVGCPLSRGYTVQHELFKLKLNKHNDDKITIHHVGDTRVLEWLDNKEVIGWPRFPNSAFLWIAFLSERLIDVTKNALKTGCYVYGGSMFQAKTNLPISLEHINTEGVLETLYRSVDYLSNEQDLSFCGHDWVLYRGLRTLTLVSKRLRSGDIEDYTNRPLGDLLELGKLDLLRSAFPFLKVCVMGGPNSGKNDLLSQLNIPIDVHKRANTDVITLLKTVNDRMILSNLATSHQRAWLPNISNDLFRKMYSAVPRLPMTQMNRETTHCEWLEAIEVAYCVMNGHGHVSQEVVYGGAFLYTPARQNMHYMKLLFASDATLRTTQQISITKTEAELRDHFNNNGKHKAFSSIHQHTVKDFDKQSDSVVLLGLGLMTKTPTELNAMLDRGNKVTGIVTIKRDTENYTLIDGDNNLFISGIDSPISVKPCWVQHVKSGMPLPHNICLHVTSVMAGVATVRVARSTVMVRLVTSNYLNSSKVTVSIPAINTTIMSLINGEPLIYAKQVTIDARMYRSVMLRALRDSTTRNKIAHHIRSIALTEVTADDYIGLDKDVSPEEAIMTMEVVTLHSNSVANKVLQLKRAVLKAKGSPVSELMVSQLIGLIMNLMNITTQLMDVLKDRLLTTITNVLSDADVTLILESQQAMMLLIDKTEDRLIDWSPELDDQSLENVDRVSNIVVDVSYGLRAKSGLKSHKHDPNNCQAEQLNPQHKTGKNMRASAMYKAMLRGSDMDVWHTISSPAYKEGEHLSDLDFKTQLLNDAVSSKNTLADDMFNDDLSSIHEPDWLYAQQPMHANRVPAAVETIEHSSSSSSESSSDVEVPAEQFESTNIEAGHDLKSSGSYSWSSSESDDSAGDDSSDASEYFDCEEPNEANKLAIAKLAKASATNAKGRTATSEPTKRDKMPKPSLPVMDAVPLTWAITSDGNSNYNPAVHAKYDKLWNETQEALANDTILEISEDIKILCKTNHFSTLEIDSLFLLMLNGINCDTLTIHVTDPLPTLLVSMSNRIAWSILSRLPSNLAVANMIGKLHEILRSRGVNVRVIKLRSTLSVDFASEKLVALHATANANDNVAIGMAHVPAARGPGAVNVIVDCRTVSCTEDTVSTLLQLSSLLPVSLKQQQPNLVSNLWSTAVDFIPNCSLDDDTEMLSANSVLITNSLPLMLAYTNMGGKYLITIRTLTSQSMMSIRVNQLLTVRTGDSVATQLREFYKVMTSTGTIIGTEKWEEWLAKGENLIPRAYVCEILRVKHNPTETHGCVMSCLGYMGVDTNAEQLTSTEWTIDHVIREIRSSGLANDVLLVISEQELAVECLALDFSSTSNTTVALVIRPMRLGYHCLVAEVKLGRRLPWPSMADYREGTQVAQDVLVMSSRLHSSEQKKGFAKYKLKGNRRQQDVEKSDWLIAGVLEMGTNTWALTVTADILKSNDTIVWLVTGEGATGVECHMVTWQILGDDAGTIVQTKHRPSSLILVQKLSDGEMSAKSIHRPRTGKFSYTRDDMLQLQKVGITTTVAKQSDKGELIVMNYDNRGHHMRNDLMQMVESGNFTVTLSDKNGLLGPFPVNRLKRTHNKAVNRLIIIDGAEHVITECNNVVTAAIVSHICNRQRMYSSTVIGEINPELLTPALIEFESDSGAKMIVLEYKSTYEDQVAKLREPALKTLLTDTVGKKADLSSEVLARRISQVSLMKLENDGVTILDYTSISVAMFADLTLFEFTAKMGGTGADLESTLLAYPPGRRDNYKEGATRWFGQSTPGGNDDTAAGPIDPSLLHGDIEFMSSLRRDTIKNWVPWMGENGVSQNKHTVVNNAVDYGDVHVGCEDMGEPLTSLDAYDFWTLEDLTMSATKYGPNTRGRLKSRETAKTTTSMVKFTLVQYPENSRPVATKMLYKDHNTITGRLMSVLNIRTMVPDTTLLLSKVARSYFHDEAKTMCEAYMASPVTYNTVATLEWIRKHHRSDYVLKELNQFLSGGTTQVQISDINIHLKLESLLKPEVIKSFAQQQPRTIMWQNYFVAAIFSPIFMELKKRLKLLLASHVIYADGYTPAQMQNKLSKIKGVNTFFQNDLEKQDRQTDEPIIHAELSLYHALGCANEVLEVWQTVHEVWRFKSQYAWGFCAGMRLSGQATTAIGNLITNILVHADFISDHVHVIKYILLLGDDNNMGLSRALSLRGLKHDIATKFNMVSKSSQSASYGEFCCFLTTLHEGTVTLVPDLKRMRNRYEVTNGTNDASAETTALRSLSYLLMLGPNDAQSAVMAKSQAAVDVISWYPINAAIHATAEKYSVPVSEVEEDVQFLKSAMLRQQVTAHEWQVWKPRVA